MAIPYVNTTFQALRQLVSADVTNAEDRDVDADYHPVRQLRTRPKLTAPDDAGDVDDWSTRS